MELPKFIRYDFLLILLGISFVGLPFYFNVIDAQPALSSSFIISGLLLLVFGLGYIKNDYDTEMDLKELEYTKLRYELITYFYKKHLLSGDDYNLIIEKLKRLIRNK